MPRGEFKLIIGNMFGNKTGRLMLEVETLRQFGRKRILIFKPDIDTRSDTGYIKDYHGKMMDALEVPARDPWQMLRVVRQKESEMGCRFHMIAVDEVQFFPTDSGFFLVVDELLDRGYNVIAAGLALDFKREPFGATLLLFGLCKSGHDCMWLNPLCARCGKPAPLPQRILDGKPAPYNAPQVQVGGKETCRHLPEPAVAFRGSQMYPVGCQGGHYVYFGYTPSRSFWPPPDRSKAKAEVRKTAAFD